MSRPAHNDSDGADYSRICEPRGRTHHSVRPSAAREVYSTLEIRHHILTLLEPNELATLLRLERAITASVACVIYWEVKESQLARMSRSDERRSICCDAVRCLRLNPPTPFHPPYPYIIHDHQPDDPRYLLPDPVRFYPGTLLTRVRSWREVFPNLSKVIHTYPANPADDAYIVLIDSDSNITVHLETRVTFNILGDPFPQSGSPVLPPDPERAEMTVHHTLAVRFITNARDTEYEWSMDLDEDRELGEEVEKWQAWLYHNPSLDPRIVSIDHDSSMIHLDMLVDVQETLNFLSNRALINCAPLRRFSIPVFGSCPYQLFLEFIYLLCRCAGTGLRELSIPLNVLSVFGDVQTALVFIDYVFPTLEHLILSEPFDDDYQFAQFCPLYGMPNLQSITLAYDPDGIPTWARGDIANSVDAGGRGDGALGDIATYLCHIGSRDCVYKLTHPDLRTTDDMTRFNDRVRALKSSPYAALKQAQINLDSLNLDVQAWVEMRSTRHMTFTGCEM